MVIAAEKKTLTAADLLRMNANGLRGELIRGVLCETMSTALTHGIIVMKLAFLLQLFIMPKDLGFLAGSDFGVLLEYDPDTVREPDIAFFSAEKIPPDAEIQPGYSRVIPDLIVEVASPRDSIAAINDKALMWLSYGARLVWTIHPDTLEVNVYRNNRRVRTLSENDVLDGADVLPGFSCNVGEIFKPYRRA